LKFVLKVATFGLDASS